MSVTKDFPRPDLRQHEIVDAGRVLLLNGGGVNEVTQVLVHQLRNEGREGSLRKSKGGKRVEQRMVSVSVCDSRVYILPTSPKVRRSNRISIITFRAASFKHLSLSEFLSGVILSFNRSGLN